MSAGHGSELHRLRPLIRISDPATAHICGPRCSILVTATTRRARVTIHSHMASTPGPISRETRRMQTRERLMGAAVAEFKRSGVAAADVASIVGAAGVAHGTFFFHFPTKEHVLLELERREEQ